MSKSQKRAARPHKQKQKQVTKSQKITDYVKPSPRKRICSAESGDDNPSDDVLAISEGDINMITLTKWIC